MVKENQRESLFRKTGFLFAGLAAIYLLLFAIFAVSDSFTSLNQAPKAQYFILVGLAIVLFCISAMVPQFYWIQPAILLAATPVPLMTYASSMFSLGFFIAAEILLSRLGFFKVARIPKYVLTIFYFYLCEILIGVKTGLSGLEIASPIVFLTIYLGFLVLVFGDKWKVFLIERKSILSLAGLRLSPMEIQYLKALRAGRSIKEIAIDGKVKESTVRNTLVRVYRKFEVQDKAALMAKCERYNLVD
jgi:DNA-binding CsgD family transcriptional regulator